MPLAIRAARALGATADLAAVFGWRGALRLERHLRSEVSTIEFDWDGQRLRIPNERGTRHHLVKSMAKLAKLVDLVPPDARTVVDIGAHSGLFSALAARRARRAKPVLVEVSFLDPDPGAVLSALTERFGRPVVVNEVTMGADLAFG